MLGKIDRKRRLYELMLASPGAYTAAPTGHLIILRLSGIYGRAGQRHPMMIEPYGFVHASESLGANRTPTTGCARLYISRDSEVDEVTGARMHIDFRPCKLLRAHSNYYLFEVAILFIVERTRQQLRLRSDAPRSII